jgi:hypothetical protein
VLVRQITEMPNASVSTSGDHGSAHGVTLWFVGSSGELWGSGARGVQMAKSRAALMNTITAVAKWMPKAVALVPP